MNSERVCETIERAEKRQGLGESIHGSTHVAHISWCSSAVSCIIHGGVVWCDGRRRFDMHPGLSMYVCTGEWV